MNNLFISASPHVAQKSISTRKIMLDVIIALLPCCIASILIFGHLVAINLILCVLFCMGAELLYNLIYDGKFNREGIKNSTVWDMSSIVTGILLALNLPTYINIFGDGNNLSSVTYTTSSGVVIFSLDTVFACFLGSIVAIMIVKMLFGGIGKNFANPAMAGRIFLFFCFTLSFKDVASYIANSEFAITGATPLSPIINNGTVIKSETSLLNMFLGTVGSSAVGETCVIAILLGYLYLSIKKVIDFRIPLIVVGSAVVFAFLFKGLGDVIDGGSATEMAKYLGIQALSGGLIFGAVFMATDYSTSPNTFFGNVLFAIGIGLFTMLIRVFGAYPEGFSFALLIMNIFAPLIDKYIIPKPFGYEKKPKPKRNKCAISTKTDKKAVATGGK